MKISKPLGAAVAVLSLGLLGAATSPAVAAPVPLPLVPFQIEDKSGNCASTEWDPRNDSPDGTTTTNWVWSKPCNALSLHQRFLYNPLTKQLSTVARPTSCIQSLVLEIRYAACDLTDRNQKYEAAGPNAAGQYTIRNTYRLSNGMYTYWSKSDASDRYRRHPLTTSQIGADEQFRFRLLDNEV